MTDPDAPSPDEPADDRPRPAQRVEGTQPILSYEPPADARNFEWVEVFLANDATHAGMLTSRLQDVGLRARVAGELSAGLGHWGLAGRAGGAGIECIAADAAEARLLIEQIEAERKRRVDARTLPCPNCGHRPANRVLAPVRWLGIAIAAVVFVGMLALSQAARDVSDTAQPAAIVILGVAVLCLLVTTKPHWVCQSCRHRWTAPAPPEVDDDDDPDEAAGNRDDIPPPSAMPR